MDSSLAYHPGLTAAQEESLATLLRSRVAARQEGRSGRLSWTRPERSPERDDYRARVSLDRAALDRLPSGRPWRGRAETGRFFSRVRWGATIVIVASWDGLASGEDGAVTVGQAVARFEAEREVWRQQFGARPFYAAVAGVFRDRVVFSPEPDLALIAWEQGAWRFCGRKSQPELADLFFPAPAEKLAEPARWQGMSPFLARLVSPFRSRHAQAEARLAARTQEFEAARRQADELRDAGERHAAAGDWSPERLQIQTTRAEEAERQARLLHRQVAALQQNLQLLTTARMGGKLVADAGLPVAPEKFESLDRAYYESQARRQEVAQAEQRLAESLLGDEPPVTELPLQIDPPARRLES